MPTRQLIGGGGLLERFAGGVSVTGEGEHFAEVGVGIRIEESSWV